jgi:DNA polymerase-3 subunit epsilon
LILKPLGYLHETERVQPKLRNGNIVDRFQSLMNTGSWIPPEIVAMTGITNQMVQDAPPAREIMTKAYAFVGDAPMVAHNATFDQRFWAYELEKCNLRSNQKFVCTMLLSRRIYPHAPNHKLSTLAQLHQLASSGHHHRAQADADMAANLYIRICFDLNAQYGMKNTSHDSLSALQSKSAKEISNSLGIKATTIKLPSNSQILHLSNQNFQSSSSTHINSIDPLLVQRTEPIPPKVSLVPLSEKKSSDTFFWICVWALGFVFLMGVLKR